jgi:hypothetical protein
MQIAPISGTIKNSTFYFLKLIFGAKNELP